MQSYPVIPIQFIVFPNFYSFKKETTCEREAKSDERLYQLHEAGTNCTSCFRSEGKQFLYHFSF